jgi:hypothetical protein
MTNSQSTYQQAQIIAVGDVQFIQEENCLKDNGNRFSFEILKSAFSEEKTLSCEWSYKFSLALMQLKRVFQNLRPKWALTKDLIYAQN